MDEITKMTHPQETDMAGGFFFVELCSMGVRCLKFSLVGAQTATSSPLHVRKSWQRVEMWRLRLLEMQLWRNDWAQTADFGLSSIWIRLVDLI